MGYTIRDHTADVAIAGEGMTIGDAFAAIADGMAAAICDEWPDCGDTIELSVTAEDLDGLLFDYLDELIYLRDVENVLPVENDATVLEHDGGWKLTGSFRGVPVTAVRAREIKAPTYADMEIRSTDSGWQAVAVLDV